MAKPIIIRLERCLSSVIAGAANGDGDGDGVFLATGDYTLGHIDSYSAHWISFALFGYIVCSLVLFGDHWISAFTGSARDQQHQIKGRCTLGVSTYLHL